MAEQADVLGPSGSKPVQVHPVPMKRKPKRKKISLTLSLRQINKQFEEWYTQEAKHHLSRTASWAAQKKFLSEKLNAYGLVSEDCISAFMRALDGLLELHHEVFSGRGGLPGWDEQSAVLHQLLKFYRTWYT